jgi:hypothetical protein
MPKIAAPLYEVEAVVGERGRGHHRELRVRWAGWQGRPDELTWEPAASVQRQVPELVERFLRAAEEQRVTLDAEKEVDEAGAGTFAAAFGREVVGSRKQLARIEAEWRAADVRWAERSLPATLGAVSARLPASLPPCLPAPLRPCHINGTDTV